MDSREKTAMNSNGGGSRMDLKNEDKYERKGEIQEEELAKWWNNYIRQSVGNNEKRKNKRNVKEFEGE